MGERCNDIGKRIKFLRTKFKLSQSQVASAIDIPQSTMWDWENGRRTLQYEELGLIAMYFTEKIERHYPKGLRAPEGIFKATETTISGVDMDTLCLGVDPTYEKLKERIRLAEENERRQVMEKLELQRRQVDLEALINETH